ncbi:MAG: hypothetical protein M4579_001030 [Chaenotheca gracillima]|nr:MAG: hypothetical protein M4579_001030 [Chaenotheca gracillima]
MAPTDPNDEGSQGEGPSGGSRSPSHHPETAQNTGAHRDSDAVPRPKRIACVICRKRKLRCDGNKPSCGTCSRLGHECAYDEYRRKSGPKRGYVKALEKRLAQVESQLKKQDVPDVSWNTATIGPDGRVETPNLSAAGFTSPDPDIDLGMRDQDGFPDLLGTQYSSIPSQQPQPSIEPTAAYEMTSLGVEEPLPPPDVANELTTLFFEKAYHSVPVIHRRRFLAAMSLPVHAQPPVCLRYAMWALAASVTDKYQPVQEYFYQMARKYIELDEMRGVGANLITIAHSQCWTLISTFEFKMMYFPRAWMSTGRATRLAQMMGLHRMDGTGLDVKQCLAPPMDWTEEEERRRTFWGAFCSDRYASIGTGWPMMIDEKDILTNLPSSEEAFDMSKREVTSGLKQALSPAGASKLSPFAGVSLMACLFGRNLNHLHRPDADNRDDDLNGDFWKRHRQMDNLLGNTALSLPDHLRLPAGLHEPNIVWTNMNIHTSIICLHQAAIFKAEKHGLSETILPESRERCISAAFEITKIMRKICHLDFSLMNPFISFCLYVAARVFAQAWKERPDDESLTSAIGFLLNAMGTLRKKHPLTESFLVQLDLDLEGMGMDHPKNNAAFSFTLKKGVSEISLKRPMDFCVPIVRPSETAPLPRPSENEEIHEAGVGSDLDAFTTNWSPANANINLPNRLKSQSNPKTMPAPMVNDRFTATVPQSQTAYLTPEMDVSPDNMDSPQNQQQYQNRFTSHHPSPSNSNSSAQYTSQSGGPPSTHASYATTPPEQIDEFSTRKSANAYADPNTQNTFYSAQDFDSLTGGTSGPTGFSPMPATPGTDHDVTSGFVMGPDWGLGASGLTPGADGIFSNIMGMTWDVTAGSGRIVPGEDN